MENLVIDLNKNFEDIFNNFSKPVFIVDDEGNVLKINKAGKNQFQISEGENIENIFEIIHSSSIAILKALPKQPFNIKRIELFGNKYLLIFDSFDYRLDIFRKIIDNSPLGVIIFDKYGKPIMYNPAFEEMWGTSEALIRDYNLFEDDRLRSTGILEKIMEVFKGKSHIFIEGYYDYLLETTKGYTIWVESKIFPITNESNEVEFVVIIHKDNSDLKLAQEEIRIANNRADEANRLKNAFLQNLSHEIRTPMNAIIGFGGLIADLVVDKIDKNDFDLLSNFNSGIIRLHRTLTQILEISQIDTGNYKIKIEPVNLKQEIEKVLDDLKSDVIQKNLDIVLNLDDEHKIILADKPALNRILTNLLENAVKFTPKGYIKIETYPNYNETLLFCSIKDTGIGISEEYLDHIFEPFSQEVDGFNRPYEGNGLGLALTKKYLDLINSSITVDSVKGVGSTFTFTLPIFNG